MKKINIITFVILSFIIASLLSSCTSSDEEVIVVRDTVVITVQPPVKNQVSVETINKRFVIQLAAFNKEENVNAFVKQAKEKLGETPEIRKYGNIFVVHDFLCFGIRTGEQHQALKPAFSLKLIK